MGLYRRKQRDGSLSATWYSRFEHRGVRVDRDTTHTSKEEARKWERREREKISGAASQRLLKKSERLTVEKAALRYWEEHLQFVTNADRSESYRLDKLVKEIGPGLPLEDLTTAHLKAVIAAKRSGGSVRGGKETTKPVAAGTINRDLRTIKAMHNMAAQVWEYPGLKTIAWTKLVVKGPKRVIKAPTVEMVRSLVASATPRLARAIMFAALTGFRLDEIKRLLWSDLDLVSDPAMVLSIGKGDKQVMLPLSSGATSLLFSMPRGMSPLVFDLKNFKREWDAAREKAGLQNTRFHDLKHAFATLFRATLKETHGQVSEMDMQAALRHSDLSTSSIYAHADNRELLPSLDKVAEKLIGSPEKLKSLFDASERGRGDQSSGSSEEAA